MSTITGIKCIGGWWEYPFKNQGDATTKIYHLRCICDANVYAPRQYDDTMDTATNAGVDQLPTGFSDANAFWVEDSELQKFKGPIFEFTRTFANIPQDRTMANDKAEPMGLRGFSFPISNESTVTFLTTGNESASFTGVGQNDGYWTITCDLAPADVATLVVDDIVEIIHNNGDFTLNASSGNYLTSNSKDRLIGCKITDITSNTVTLTTNFGGYSSGTNRILGLSTGGWVITSTSFGTLTTFNVRKVSLIERFERFDVESPHFLESRYIKTNDYFELNTGLQQRFTPLRSDGKVLTSDAALTSSTSPTADEYGELVYYNEYINAEAEAPRRWMGNIFVKELLKVKAL